MKSGLISAQVKRHLEEVGAFLAPKNGNPYTALHTTNHKRAVRLQCIITKQKVGIALKGGLGKRSWCKQELYYWYGQIMGKAMKPKRRFALTGIEDRLDHMLPHTAEQTPQYKGRGADKPAPRPLYGFTRSFRPLLQANLISAVLVPIGHGIHAALDKS